jgi:hypothetical protein
LDDRCKKRRFKALLESRLAFWLRGARDLIFARTRVAVPL